MGETNRKEYMRAYHNKYNHTEGRQAYLKKWREENKERLKEYNNKYYESRTKAKRAAQRADSNTTKEKGV